MVEQLKVLYEKGMEAKPAGGRIRPVAQEGDGVFGYTLFMATADGEYYVEYKSPIVDGGGLRRVFLKGVVYIAGPMRGLLLYNFPAFDAARDRLIELGYYVFNPADLDRAAGVTEFTPENEFPPDFMRDAMDRDLNAITKCTHVALLPGWEASRGVRPEAVLANELKLTFLLGDMPDKVVPNDAIMAVVGGRLIGEYYAKCATGPVLPKSV